MKDSYTASSSRQAQVAWNDEIYDEQSTVEPVVSRLSEKPLSVQICDAVSIEGPQGLTRDAILQEFTSIDGTTVSNCIDSLLHYGLLVSLKTMRRNRQGQLERVIVDVCNEALAEALCRGELA